MKALVRWAAGKRLTNRLPKLSLITLSSPLNRGILGLCMGPYVPTPRFFYSLWGPRESDSSDSWHEEIRFSLKSVFMVDVRFELTTNDPWSVDDAICEGISPLGYWWKVHPVPSRHTTVAAAAAACCCYSSSCVGWQKVVFVVRCIWFQCFLSLHSNTIFVSVYPLAVQSHFPHRFFYHK